MPLNFAEQTLPHGRRPAVSEWETFCDPCYYDLWRVRRKNERGFNDGYHIHNGEEARALVELLNKLERELQAERALADRLAKAVQNHFDVDGDMWATQAQLDNTTNRLESALAAWKEARNE